MRFVVPVRYSQMEWDSSSAGTRIPAVHSSFRRVFAGHALSSAKEKRVQAQEASAGKYAVCQTGKKGVGAAGYSA